MTVDQSQAKNSLSQAINHSIPILPERRCTERTRLIRSVVLCKWDILRRHQNRTELPHVNVASETLSWSPRLDLEVCVRGCDHKNLVLCVEELVSHGDIC